jgi:hypothetical protein
MDETRLIERLRSIEALHAGATTPGERAAAARGRERLLEHLQSLERGEEPEEFQFTMGDTWSRKVFCALLRRYGIRPYRYPRQRRTTVMARVPRRFVDETLWPEFQEINRELMAYLQESTDRILRRVLEADGGEAEVRAEPPRIGDASNGA